MECNECLTIQEHYIASILDSLERQHGRRIEVTVNDVLTEDGKPYVYTWDFMLWDIGLVIQADGVNGHGTRYSLTDDVMQCRMGGAQSILHLEAETEEELRKIIVKALDSIEDS